MQQMIALIPGIPLIGALFVHLLSDRLGRRVVRISIAGLTATFALSVVMLVAETAGTSPSPISLTTNFGVLLSDPLSALMGLLISGISLIVHLYSVRYMIEEPGYARFFVLLDLMTAALLVMVAAGDLVTLLVAWNMIGVLLYFLLGQNTRSAGAYRYAFWTFITYRIGDVALVLAAALLVHAYGSWSLPEIFQQLNDDAVGETVFGFSVPQLVGALLALAAFARSAQFLLHTWLPYTMDGPTPVSALMHAGIVNAGGFLVNRFAPVFIHAGDVLHALFIVGLITAVIGSVLMLTQNDVKKSLGYSTMGQMGFMVMECGVGAFSLAIYHLIAHGMFKGTLFLGAGGVIGEARKDDGVPKDRLYTFVVERRPARIRQPWLVMAALTLAAPVVILAVAHWLVSQDFFQKQSAIVLLFFGWMTGAQLIFATYRMRTENMRRLLGLIVFSFTIIVVGYALISHVFDLFLYPEAAFRARIYEAAGFDVVWFDVLVVLVTCIIVLGWLSTYYAERDGKKRGKSPGPLWMSFYALVSREFYLSDIYAWMSRAILAAAARLNVWLRWV